MNAARVDLAGKGTDPRTGLEFSLRVNGSVGFSRGQFDNVDDDQVADGAGAEVGYWFGEKARIRPKTARTAVDAGRSSGRPNAC